MPILHKNPCFLKKITSKIKKIRYAHTLSVFILCAAPFASQATDTSDLKAELKALKKQIHQLNTQLYGSSTSTSVNYAERIKALEESLWAIEEKLGERTMVQAFDGVRFDLGGFIHTAYTTIDAEDGTRASFDRQNFELLIGAELDDNWSAFFAGGFLRESDPSLSLTNRTSPQFNARNKNPQIIGWVNYEHSSALNVRIGRMITPHGIINIEHFPGTLLDPEQPQFLRPFSGDTIFPNFATGMQLHGKKYLSSISYEYAVYATNMSSNADKLQVGGRYALGFMQDKVAMGINFANGKRANEVDYTLVGLDFKLDIGRFLLKSELYQTSESADINSVDNNRSTFYIQPAWRFSPKWIAFTRIDTLNMGDAEGQADEVAIGLNYLHSSNVRLRAILTERDYKDGTQDDANAHIFQISGTFSF